jgi:hypothetical protein
MSTNSTADVSSRELNHLHYWLTAVLAILLVPACLFTRLRLTAPPELAVWLVDAASHSRVKALKRPIKQLDMGRPAHELQ